MLKVIVLAGVFYAGMFFGLFVGAMLNAAASDD